MTPQTQALIGQAVQFLQNGQPEKAESILKKILEVHKNNLPALEILGLIKGSQGKHDECATYLQKAVQLNPNNISVQYNLAKALSEIGKHQEALVHHRITTSLSPNNHEAWLNLGKSLIQLNQISSAITAFKTSLNIKPKSWEAMSNLASALKEINKENEALIIYLEAFEINSKSPEIAFNIGTLYLQQKKYEEAIYFFEIALTINPNLDFLLGSLIHTKNTICDWSDINNLISKLEEMIRKDALACQPLVMMSITDNPELIFLASKSLFKEDSISNIPVLKNQKRVDCQKIKIGYFSPDFFDHPVSQLIIRVLELHDRNNFEVYGFSTRKHHEDCFNKRLNQSVDKMIDVSTFSYFEIANLAREIGLDIAIDLCGHTSHSLYRIFEQRVAPIQINFLGFAATMGVKYYDYILADKYVITSDQTKFYAEEVLYLSDLFLPDDPNRMPQETTKTRSSFGLPESSFIFCNFNQSFKYSQKMIAIWSEILKAVPDSVFWLSANNRLARSNLLKEFESFGVSPSRIIFADRVDSVTDHLARHKLANLFLDTFPYNAHTGTLDAIKCGVPVLTISGRSFASRVAGSVLNSIGLDNLIAQDYGAYIKTAINLGTSSEFYNETKTKLVAKYKNSNIGNPEIFCRNLEGVYKSLLI